MKPMRLPLLQATATILLLAVAGLFVAPRSMGEQVVAAPLAGDHTPTGTRTVTNTPTPMPTALPCGDWRLVPSPNGTTRTNYLQDVAVLSQNDVWAVGYQDFPSLAGLIMHWDGNAWTLVPSPAAGAYLHGVAAIAPDDVWAVGHFDAFPARTLTLHWDGISWSVVPSPNPGAGNNFLYAVAAGGTDDVWAVGQGTYHTLAMHWDGTQWSVVPTPTLDGGALQGVTVLSQNDVWAVGSGDQYVPLTTLALHWDGTSWTEVETPSPGTHRNQLSAISAVAPDDIWAVGWWADTPYAYVRLIVHWDGTSWNEVPAPFESQNPQINSFYLEGVSALSANEVWAVGRDEIDASDSVAVVLRWDGSSWTQVDITQPSASKNRLWGVAAVQPGEAWAVGNYWLSGPGYGTLTMRYGPQCGIGTPGTSTQTPRPPTSTPLSTTSVTPVPTVCGLLLSEGFEGGTLGQFTSIVTQCPSGGCGWVSSTATPHSGTHAAFAPDVTNISDQRLQLITRVVPVVGSTLTFWHSYDFESSFDGGVLEASTNYGNTWSDMGQNIISGGYNGAISHIFDNPLAGREAWTGTSGGYVRVVVNLTPYAARNLLIRFRLGTDTSLAAPGWHIDDVVVEGSTSCPTSTFTPTSVAGTTSTPVPTDTAVLPTRTVTPDPTAEACNVTFSDVQPDHTFYAPVMCLACHNIIGGYADGTFRPQNEVTRGQLAKLVSNAAGFNEPVGATDPAFTDVPADSPFYIYVERVASRRVITGYPCGGPGEPCDAGNRPYFRPGANATRGQMSKIVSIAAKMTDAPTGQSFEDVPADHPFYLGVERLAMHHMMSGYPCGGPGEPCGPDNKPYFRPSNNATRGQTSKIIANTFYPDCQITGRP